MKAVHFGAGNIGKGLIGLILSNADFEVIYIDADKKSVDLINKNNGFNVGIIGENDVIVSNVKAIHVSDRDNIENAILEADLITTSVGATNLVRIAPILLTNLLKRTSSIDIIANENMINASDALKNEVYNLANSDEKIILDKLLFFSNSAIDRLALSNEKGTIVEPYFEWVVDKTNLFSTAIKNIKGVTYTDNMTCYIERKLFCVNANHAAVAYLAYEKGLTYVYEAFLDKDIVDIINGMHQEIMSYFIKQYDFDRLEHEKFIEKTIIRHANCLLKDKVVRVGASPLRKLGASERLVGPFLQLVELNLPRENLARVIASALKFDFLDDIEAVKIKESSIDDILTNHSKIPKEKQDIILKNL